MEGSLIFAPYQSCLRIRFMYGNKILYSYRDQFFNNTIGIISKDRIRYITSAAIITPHRIYVMCHQVK
jgi:hypothetical protein